MSDDETFLHILGRHLQKHPERYEVGEVVHVRTAQGIDPDPSIIHKVLDDGKYVLFRYGSWYPQLFRHESLQHSQTNVRNHHIVQRPSPKAKSSRKAQGKVKMETQKLPYDENNDKEDHRRSGVEVSASVGPSANPSEVKNSMEVETNDLTFSINGSSAATHRGRTDNAHEKLHLGKKLSDILLLLVQNVAMSAEYVTKLSYGDASPPFFLQGRTLEGVSTQNDQPLRQGCPKEARRRIPRTVLSTFGLRERPLENGKTHVRWRCICGRNMYDDFTELRPGAAAEFEKLLNQSMRNHLSSDASNPTQGSIQRSATSPSEVDVGHQPTAAGDISLQRRINALEGFGGNAAITLDINLEKCWLIVCGQLQRGPDSLLTHLDLSHTPSDKTLFTEMRKFYSNLRTRWDLRWDLRSFLRGVRTIRFVQFELHKMDRVDIRKVPDMPPKSRRDEYLYEHCELIPPVGENFMTHWFQHPEDAWDMLHAYSRFPKKRKGQLEVNPSHGPRVGWGI